MAGVPLRPQDAYRFPFMDQQTWPAKKKLLHNISIQKRISEQFGTLRKLFGKSINGLYKFIETSKWFLQRYQINMVGLLSQMAAKALEIEKLFPHPQYV